MSSFEHQWIVFSAVSDVLCDVFEILSDFAIPFLLHPPPLSSSSSSSEFPVSSPLHFHLPQLSIVSEAVTSIPLKNDSTHKSSLSSSFPTTSHIPLLPISSSDSFSSTTEMKTTTSTATTMKKTSTSANTDGSKTKNIFFDFISPPPPSPLPSVFPGFLELDRSRPFLDFLDIFHSFLRLHDPLLPNCASDVYSVTSEYRKCFCSFLNENRKNKNSTTTTTTTTPNNNNTNYLDNGYNHNSNNGSSHIRENSTSGGCESSSSSGGVRCSNSSSGNRSSSRNQQFPTYPLPFFQRSSMFINYNDVWENSATKEDNLREDNKWSERRFMSPSVSNYSSSFSSSFSSSSSFSYSLPFLYHTIFALHRLLLLVERLVESLRRFQSQLRLLASPSVADTSSVRVSDYYDWRKKKDEHQSREIRGEILKYFVEPLMSLPIIHELCLVHFVTYPEVEPPPSSSSPSLSLLPLNSYYPLSFSSSSISYEKPPSLKNLQNHVTYDEEKKRSHYLSSSSSIIPFAVFPSFSSDFHSSYSFSSSYQFVRYVIDAYGFPPPPLSHLRCQCLRLLHQLIIVAQLNVFEFYTLRLGKNVPLLMLISAIGNYVCEDFSAFVESRSDWLYGSYWLDLPMDIKKRRGEGRWRREEGEERRGVGEEVKTVAREEAVVNLQCVVLEILQTLYQLHPEGNREVFTQCNLGRWKTPFGYISILQQIVFLIWSYLLSMIASDLWDYPQQLSLPSSSSSSSHHYLSATPRLHDFYSAYASRRILQNIRRKDSRSFYVRPSLSLLPSSFRSSSSSSSSSMSSSAADVVGNSENERMSTEKEENNMQKKCKEKCKDFIYNNDDDEEEEECFINLYFSHISRHVHSSCKISKIQQTRNLQLVLTRSLGLLALMAYTRDRREKEKREGEKRGEGKGRREGGSGGGGGGVVITSSFPSSSYHFSTPRTERDGEDEDEDKKEGGKSDETDYSYLLSRKNLGKTTNLLSGIVGFIEYYGCDRRISAFLQSMWKNAAAIRHRLAEEYSNFS